jgi:hypothetical protein
MTDFMLVKGSMGNGKGPAGMHGRHFEILSPSFQLGSCSSDFFSAGDLTYSHDDIKTIKPPGIVRGVIDVPEIAGDTKRSIPVATAVARHLITASASSTIQIRVSNSLKSIRSEEIHTLINSSNSKSNKDITEDDKVRRQIRIPLKQARLFRLDDANSVMY